MSEKVQVEYYILSITGALKEILWELLRELVFPVSLCVVSIPLVSMMLTLEAVQTPAVGTNFFLVQRERWRWDISSSVGIYGYNQRKVDKCMNESISLLAI